MSLPLNQLIKRNAKPARVISTLCHYLFLVFFFFLISFVLYALNSFISFVGASHKSKFYV